MSYSTPRDDMYSKENVAKRKFWKNVLITPSCWLWQGAKNSGGYGRTAVVNDKKETIHAAHRFTYHYLVEDLIPGMEVDHKYVSQGCPRHCVNPEHLQQVSKAVNMANRKGSRYGSLSGYRGVVWRKRDNAWEVVVTINLERILGKRYYPPYERHIAAFEARQLRRTHHNNTLEGIIK